MEYRLLQPSEFEKVVHIFEEQGSRPPDPHSGFILVGEEQGEIVAFMVGQLIPHSEPIWVHPDYRKSGIAKSLLPNFDIVAKDIGWPYYLAVVDNSIIERMATEHGLTPMSGAIYCKKLME